MPRAKKVSQFKHKEPKVQPMGGGTRGKGSRLSKADIAEGEAAIEKVKNRPTSDFSTEELGSLMQIAPGEAMPNQIRPSRQFGALE